MSKVCIYKNGVEIGNLVPFSFVEMPIYNNKPKYTKFKNFLENNVENTRSFLTCSTDIGALEVESNAVLINTDKCIGCLLCLCSQKNSPKISIEMTELLHTLIPNFEKIDETIRSKDIFNGEIVELPTYSHIIRKLTSLMKYTSVKETEHISLWSTVLLNFLSSFPKSRMGKEIEIKKMDHPRDGRLDICVISGDNIIVCETKISLGALLQENRYRIQIPAYKRECEKIIEDNNLRRRENKKLQIYLLIGGEETDLFPPNHPLCTSNEGNSSYRFYNDLTKYNIKFISANALWLMALRSLILNKRLCWDLLFTNIFAKNVIGLLTAGVVVNENEELKVSPVPTQALKSSERAFS